jgi:hypothetical protein
MAPLATQAVHGVYNAKCIFRFGRTIGLPKRRGRPPLTEDRPKRPPRGDLPTHPARTGCGDEEDCEIGDRGFLYLRKNRSPICDSSQIDFLCRVPIAQGRVFTPRCYPQAVHSPITQLSLKLFSIGQDLSDRLRMGCGAACAVIQAWDVDPSESRPDGQNCEEDQTVPVRSDG